MVILDTLRGELSARIPGADFTSYFAFIESRPLRTKEDSERHHILPQREFPIYKKNPDNRVYLSPGDHLLAHHLLAVCAPRCLTLQRTFFLMTITRKAANLLSPKEVEVCVDTYEKGREVQKKAARILGLIQGPKNAKNGHLDLIRPDPEVNRIQGCKNVENGHLARIRNREASVKGGRAGSRSAFKSGALNRNFKRARHVRWHVNRNMISSNCDLCQEASNA